MTAHRKGQRSSATVCAHARKGADPEAGPEGTRRDQEWRQERGQEQGFEVGV